MGELSASEGSPSGRRLDVQGLRALAVLLVVAFHADLPIPGGFVGVDVFFVISGFVITAMLLRQLEPGNGVGFTHFYTRRFRRLLPALALTTTVVGIASIVLLSPLGPLQATVPTGIAASLFSANLQLSQVASGGYFDLDAEANALLHTWSLSVEEQFYLVFPAFLVLAWTIATRRGRTSRALATAIVGVVLAGSFALCVLLTYRPSTRLGSSFAFYASPTRAWEFGAGVVLALALPVVRRVPAAIGEALLVVGLGLVGVAAFAFDGTTTFPGVAAAVPVAGTTLAIAGATVSTRGLGRVLSCRPAVWIGDVSYGWYLWHWPLIVFAAAWWPGRSAALVVASLVALGPTALSYRFLEQPIRTNDSIVGRRAAGLVAVCVLVPIAAFGVAGAVGHAARRDGSVAEFADQIREHADRERGCDSKVPLGEREGDDCTWPASAADPGDGDPGADGELVLVGDSNAGHVTEPVVAAGNQAGLDVTVATSAGCPFADLIRRESFAGTFDGEACREQVLATVDELVARRARVVVIAMSSTEYVEDPLEHLRLAEGPEASDPEGKAAVYEEGLGRVVATLHEAGTAVLVVHPVPQFGAVLGGSWSAETCPAAKIWQGWTCGGARSRAEVDRAQARTYAAEEGAVAAAIQAGPGGGGGRGGAAGAATVGFDDVLCPEDRCATERAGRVIYRDATHLSVGGALDLTEGFEVALASLLAG